MRYLVSLAMLLVLASGCTLVFVDGDGDDDICVFAEPASVPAPQRNPDTLTCQSFGGGCFPGCGPCPAAEGAAEAAAESALSQPSPSWGFCGSTCEALPEAACAKDPGCRVVKDAACAVSGDCTTDFLGCFPTDQFTDPEVDCFAARDGFTCSQSAACTAYHRGARTLQGPPDPGRTFAMCAPEGTSPGTCFGQVICRAAPPACPSSTTPGIENGCYTGACIPLDVCGPVP
jgi:hypothetical protein